MKVTSLNRLFFTDNDTKTQILNFLDVVCSTLGPSGNTVFLGYNNDSNPLITKDGISVASNYTTSDVLAQSIITMMTEASFKTSESVGDGTTTTLAILKGLLTRFINSNGVFNRDEFEEEVTQALLDLESYKIVVDLDNYLDIVKKVSLVSTNNSEEVSNLVTEAFEKAGYHGEVNFTQVTNQASFLTHSVGMSLDITQEIPVSSTKKLILQNAKILMVNSDIDTINKIADVVGECHSQKIPLVIIAKDFSPSVKNNIINNVNRAKLQVYLLSPVVFGESRLQTLYDVSCMLFGDISEVYSSDFSTERKLSDVKFKELPTVKEINILNNNIIVPHIDELSTFGRLQEVKKDLNNSDVGTLEHKILSIRQSRLKGSICTINVGGSTTTETKELYDRVEDAVFACKSALKQGILPGGGSILYNLVSPSSSLSYGFKEPFNCLASNCNKTSVKPPVGVNSMNFKTGKQCDLIKDGIFDSYESVKQAIINSTSVFKTLMSSKYFMIEEKHNG